MSASYLDVGLSGTVAQQSWFREVFPDIPVDVSDTTTLEVVKDQVWTSWVSLATGIVLIIVGIVWFIFKFEIDRRKQMLKQ